MQFAESRHGQHPEYTEPTSDAQTFRDSSIFIDVHLALSDAQNDVEDVQSEVELKGVLAKTRTSIVTRVKGRGSHDGVRALGLINDFEHDALEWFRNAR